MTDATMALVWDIVYLLLLVFAFHGAISTKDHALKSAARRAFLPVWMMVRNHHNMVRGLLDEEYAYAAAPPSVRRT
jgi:hypothetical protein